MIGGTQPIVFHLSGMQPSASLRGVSPFYPRVFPPVGITPFGKTDADIKGPTIPKPILFSISGLRLSKGGMFHPASAMRTLPGVYLRIFGVTKDSTGAVLPTCVVHLFETLTDKYIEQTVSDASGNYEFRSASTATRYFVVAYKAGSPDVAGTTVNTLVGT